MAGRLGSPIRPICTREHLQARCLPLVLAVRWVIRDEWAPILLVPIPMCRLRTPPMLRIHRRARRPAVDRRLVVWPLRLERNIALPLPVARRRAMRSRLIPRQPTGCRRNTELRPIRRTRSPPHRTRPTALALSHTWYVPLTVADDQRSGLTMTMLLPRLR